MGDVAESATRAGLRRCRRPAAVVGANVMSETLGGRHRARVRGPKTAAADRAGRGGATVIRPCAPARWECVDGAPAPGSRVMLAGAAREVAARWWSCPGVRLRGRSAEFMARSRRCPAVRGRGGGGRGPCRPARGRCSGTGVASGMLAAGRCRRAPRMLAAGPVRGAAHGPRSRRSRPEWPSWAGTGWCTCGLPLGLTRLPGRRVPAGVAGSWTADAVPPTRS